MDDISVKIKRIYVPYLIISMATLIVSTYLHWLLFVKFNIPRGIGGLLVFVVPLVLSLTSIVIWLYKRMNLRSTKRGSILEVMYLLVPSVAMGGLSIYGQQYFTLTNSKLIQLSSISQIDKGEPSKFYTLKNFYLDKKHFSIRRQFFNPNRSPNLEMHMYIAVPVLNLAKDTLGSNCIGWYGIHYTDTAYGFEDAHNIKGSNWRSGEAYSNDNVFDTYDNSIEQVENSNEFKKFVSKSMMQFDNLDINNFLYLERIAKNESDYGNYVSAIRNNTKYDTKSEVVLLPVNKPLIERANDNLKAALWIFGVGSLLFLIMVFNPKLKSEVEVSDVPDKSPARYSHWF